MLDATARSKASCPLLRALGHLVRARRSARRGQARPWPARRWLAGAALLAECAGAVLPLPASAAALDALDPFDPVGSDPWLGPLAPTALYTAAEPPTRGRGPWLGLGAGLASSPGERRRVFALIELGIPLDALANASATEAAEGEASDIGGIDAAAEAGDRPDAHEPTRRAARMGEGAGSGDEASHGARVSLAAGRSRAPLRRSLAGEASSDGGVPAVDTGSGNALHAAGAIEAREVSSSPDPGALAPLRLPPPMPGCIDSRSCDPAALMPLARAAVAEALRVQGGQTELRRLDGMAARSRAAASLPEVRLGAGTSRDESLRLAPTAADPARFTRDGGRDLWLEARLTWRLDGAIFARDEIAIMRLRAQQREETARLAAEVLESLVAFERARLRLASELAGADERDQALVVQFGALARLDVLTDGWFSRQLERSAKAGRQRWP